MQNKAPAISNKDFQVKYWVLKPLFPRTSLPGDKKVIMHSFDEDAKLNIFST